MSYKQPSTTQQNVPPEPQKNCCHLLANEFKCHKFGLSHEEPVDFLRSQWHHIKPCCSYAWITYRWLLAIYFSVSVIFFLIQSFQTGIYFMYLADWALVLCMYVTLFGAVLSTIHNINPTYFSRVSVTLKIYWASHWATLIFVITITLLYFYLYTTDAKLDAELVKIWMHALNSVLLLLDHFLVAFPSRLLHFIYPIGILFVYSLYSLFYYLADEKNAEQISKILNWSIPHWTIVFLCVLLGVVLALCKLLFWLHHIRLWIHRKTIKTANDNQTKIDKK